MRDQDRVAVRDALLAEANRKAAEWTRKPTMNPTMAYVHPEPLRALLQRAADSLKSQQDGAQGGDAVDAPPVPAWLVDACQSRVWAAAWEMSAKHHTRPAIAPQGGESTQGSWIAEVFKPLPASEVEALRSVGAPGFAAPQATPAAVDAIFVGYLNVAQVRPSETAAFPYWNDAALTNLPVGDYKLTAALAAPPAEVKPHG